jgi:hypothetical protein
VSFRIVRIVRDTSGGLFSHLVTDLVVIPETLDVTPSELELLLQGLQLGPYGSDDIVSVEIESPPSLEGFLISHSEKLMSQARDDTERQRLAEQLQTKLRALRALSKRDN